MWLWREGLGLAGLSLLIGVSGLSFAAALGPWSRRATERSTRALVLTGLALEILLVAFVVLLPEGAPARAPVVTAAVLGLANGAYNAWFWTTQRLLFAARLGANDAGRRYGAFQVYVAVLLKAGLVAGGLMLEAGGLGWLLLLSLAVAAGTGAWLLPRLPREPIRRALARPATNPATNPATGPMIDPGTGSTAGPLRPLPGWRASLAGRDRFGARPTFAVDGVFLFLESHFWTLTLFLALDEDYARLGVIVVVLGVAFGALFWLARGAIDRVRPAAVYRLAVVLYALSWLLRARTDALADTHWLGPLLVSITFCSSFFRLAFNKRFFEHALASGDVAHYLVWKSHLSQTVLGAVFAGVALALALGPGDPLRTLDACYAFAALAALAYLAWRPAPSGEVPRAHRAAGNDPAGPRDNLFRPPEPRA